ncbi:hypothetical protein [Vulgatibacter incomptus]|uniref:Uncharacterized protein n=1 Tax=Vulgatibacter incomptus TaxID=1391653 RepID=A0A0K1PBT0_9BACT|nr:hypothetical protein [Vulgatibacter incomptus]AKU90861.1 hypothetical protein AKJ08_1248 [Vulgatibacter incomptus]
MSLAAALLLGISCTSEPAKPLFAGEGLQRNRDQLDLRRAYRLPQECAAGSLPRFDSVAGEWLCGSVESVIAEGAGWVLDPAHRLPQQCAAGSLPRFDVVASEWTCGSVESVIAEGAGWVLDPAQRLPRQCATGSLPRFDAVAAEWTCGSVESVIAEGAGWVLDPASRLPERCSNGQTVNWNGTGWACAGGDSERVIVVRATNDDFANAAKLRAAVKKAKDLVIGVPQWPVVVQLEPGAYLLGNDPLELPFNVSLEGIGPEVILQGGWNGEPVVSMIYGSRLRRLVISSTSNGVSVRDGRVRLEEVTIVSSGSAVIGHPDPIEIARSQLYAVSDQTDGIAVSGGSWLLLESSVVSAPGASVRVTGDGQSLVSVQGGFLNGTVALENTFARITGAQINSEVQALFSLGANASVEVRASELTGPRLRADTTIASTLRIGGSTVSVSEPSGAPSKCVHSYDADFEPLNPDCSQAAVH